VRRDSGSQATDEESRHSRRDNEADQQQSAGGAGTAERVPDRIDERRPQYAGVIVAAIPKADSMTLHQCV
jgi:hypothetical protein